MANKQVEETTICIPKELKIIFKKNTAQIIRQIKLAAAVELFREGYLSLGKGAALADIPKWEFIKELGQRKVSIFRIDKKELKQDIIDA